MQTKGLYFGLAGAALLAFGVAAYQANERRFRALQREVRAAAAQNESEAPAERRAPMIVAAAQPIPKRPEASPPPAKAETTDDTGEAAASVVSDADQAAYVETVYSEQTTDRAWAADAERSIGSALKAHVGTSKVESLKCRENLCQAKLSHESATGLSDFVDRLIVNNATVWKGAITSHRDADENGVVRTTMYFSKEGQDMPQLH